MQAIYSMIDFILPFDFLSFDFMKNAFLAILIITPLFAVLGTMVVNNKMAFFSDALGHSALTGIAIGALFGLQQPLLSMIGFAVIFALLLSWMKSKVQTSTDTIISVFSSTAVAVGLVVLSYNRGFAQYSSYLVGDIISVTVQDLLFLFAAFVLVLIIWGTIYNDLLIISVNPSLARSKNIPVKLIENIFLILVAVIVTLSIKWIGILVINSLLIIPCAAARNVSSNARTYQAASVMFSLFSGMVGLVISYYCNTAMGPTIVIVSAVLFLITTVLHALRKNEIA